MLNSSQVDASLPGNVSQLLSGGGENSLVNAGSGLLSSLLGSKANMLGSALSSMSGISGSSATNLLSMAAPLVLGSLKKVVGDQGLNANGLMSLLGSQSRHLENQIDPRLSEAMNLRLPGVGPAATTAVDTAKSSVGKTMPWVALAAALLLGLLLFRTWSTDRARRGAEEARAAQAAAQRVATTRVAVVPIRSIDLPNGVKVQAPQGGLIDSLVIFLSNPDWAAGKSFACDGVNFESDSATLASTSTPQLTKLATVLNAYPSAALSVNGYTDNTGDPAANKKLSEDRAAAVKSALVNMGLSPDRVTSEGWGAEKPIASNDTEEGRLKNRRVEITLQKK
jgi:outer membrane protein OmpA-like peptidoglycan-associated protein